MTVLPPFLEAFPPHTSAWQQVAVAVTGWRVWHALGLAPSSVAAEGRCWWSLGRRDGIVGRAEGGGGRSPAVGIEGPEYTRLSSWSRTGQVDEAGKPSLGLEVDAAVKASEVSVCSVTGGQPVNPPAFPELRFLCTCR
ncbi:hypothetical protein EYF80_060200 [Liparis tanakae]|uniref:Uncharacterized protein n=1 Tax=Liparis tanakae TaxID=230148 RepID=A0A4Z2EM54_9TELE|nr:hypothetical protein EYF80_060200 [Liparis tanakae]